MNLARRLLIGLLAAIPAVTLAAWGASRVFGPIGLALQFENHGAVLMLTEGHAVGILLEAAKLDRGWRDVGVDVGVIIDTLVTSHVEVDGRVYSHLSWPDVETLYSKAVASGVRLYTLAATGAIALALSSAGTVRTWLRRRRRRAVRHPDELEARRPDGVSGEPEPFEWAPPRRCRILTWFVALTTAMFWVPWITAATGGPFLLSFHRPFADASARCVRGRVEMLTFQADYPGATGSAALSDSGTIGFPIVDEDPFIKALLAAGFAPPVGLAGWRATFGLPLPALLSAAALAALLAWSAGRTWFRRRRGLCLRCSYDLRGNISGRCPECGAVKLHEGARTSDAG